MPPRGFIQAWRAAHRPFVLGAGAELRDSRHRGALSGWLRQPGLQPQGGVGVEKGAGSGLRSDGS